MHLHEGQFYLISNRAVARNPLFCEILIQDHFRKKMEYYLSPLCKILAYSLKDHEFQMLIKLKEREDFEFYFNQKTEQIKGYQETPQSTYIFSQVMSNLQVSLVKKFNHYYHRSGTLMAGRFKRKHIASEQEVINEIQALNNSEVKHKYSGIWAECAMKRIEGKTSKVEYKRLEMKHKGGISGFWNEFRNNLVDEFNNIHKNDQFPAPLFHRRRLFRSLCHFFE
jgi:hypothetical protein